MVSFISMPDQIPSGSYFNLGHSVKHLGWSPGENKRRKKKKRKSEYENLYKLENYQKIRIP